MSQDPPTLIDRAQKGDSQAFEDLLTEYRARLERHVQARLGAHLRSKVDVQDVLQETYARAWKSVERFRWAGSNSFLNWLKGISEHVILKLASRHRPRQVIYVKDRTRHADITPSRAQRREERFDRLQEALDRLSPEYREAVMLVRVEGLQIKEAARRMNRTPKSVAHLLARGLKKLKEGFGETESLHLPPRRLEGGEANHEH
jgi:RNA polymerase sigma-70 factor (ECF subfamily)